MNDNIKKLNDDFSNAYAEKCIHDFVTKLKLVRMMYVCELKLMNASFATRWYWKIKYNKAIRGIGGLSSSIEPISEDTANKLLIQIKKQ